MARLVQNLTKIAALAPHAAAAALNQTGEDILEISQGFVPVDKGDLKASGGVEVKSQTHIEVGYGKGLPIYGGDQTYANAQEYGTVNMAAQPYLTPAFVRAQNIFHARLGEEVRKINGVS